MAAKPTITSAAGDSLTPPAAARPSIGRFSLLSLLTNNQTSRTSFRTKKQKNDKKNQAKCKPLESVISVSTSVGGGSAGSGGSAVSATPNTLAVDVPSRTRLDSAGVELRECPLCYDELPTSSYPQLIIGCGHKSCASCMEEYLKIEIGESRVDISCPECREKLHPADIQQLLKAEPAYVFKYEQFMVRRVLVTDPDTRWCPAPDCGYAVIATGCAGCPTLQCQRPECATLFCYHCKQKWHPNQTCDAARRERFPTEMRLSLSDIQTLARTAEEYKSCPRCQTMINKMDDGSCNHMTCSICGAQFCWLCLKEASDLHYLSPSGCTFWGKKPWSKKKKILWQLGTLVGAPIGIALIAGLSVPVLIFGLPIWTGRKLYQRFKNANKHKRNAIVTFGTAAALIASPILAGITIAIGVPVMLVYVYGVVPYSLCRGGTCGVKNDGGMLSFDFNGGGGGSSGDESSAVVVRGNDGTFRVANPSIGPSIGENSLQAGFALSASGIQMDRVGLTDDQSDTKSASMKNMAGTSITGSIYEPETAAAAAAFHQRLEIKAEVSLRPGFSSERKNSIDSQTLSQSDSRSLRSFGPSDNRSHVSFSADSASMKAMAGSISAPRDKDGMSVSLPPQDLNFYEVRSKSCMRTDHGSPVSNRSVSFAAHDGKSKSKKKPSKRRQRAEAAAAAAVAATDLADRLSRERRGGGESLDTVSNSSSADTMSINKRFTAAEYTQQGAEVTASPAPVAFSPQGGAVPSIDCASLDSVSPGPESHDSFSAGGPESHDSFSPGGPESHDSFSAGGPESRDSAGSATKEPLTEIEVDKPQQHQYHTVVIRQTVSSKTNDAAHPTEPVPTMTQPLEGKVLCNILEDRGLAV